MKQDLLFSVKLQFAQDLGLRLEFDKKRKRNLYSIILAMIVHLEDG